MKKFIDRLNPLTQVMLFFSALLIFAFVFGNYEIEYGHAGGGPVVISDQTSTATTSTAAVVANKLYTVDAGYLNQIREGNIPGHTFVTLKGNNIALGTPLTEVSILSAAFPGAWPAAEGVITIISDSALDTTGGTGALTITLDVLDSTFSAPVIAPVITMQGLDSVFSLDSYYRINGMTVTTAGSGNTNKGKITASIGGTAIIAMQDGHSTTTEGRITVPADMDLYLENAAGSAIGTNKNAAIHLYTRNTQVPDSPFILLDLFQTQAGGYTPDGKVPGIPEKTDVILMGSGSAAANVVEASYQGWLEE